MKQAYQVNHMWDLWQNPQCGTNLSLRFFPPLPSSSSLPLSNSRDQGLLQWCSRSLSHRILKYCSRTERIEEWVLRGYYMQRWSEVVGFVETRSWPIEFPVPWLTHSHSVGLHYLQAWPPPPPAFQRPPNRCNSVQLNPNRNDGLLQKNYLNLKL